MNNEDFPVTTPSLQLPSACSTSITPLPVPDESDHRGNGKIARLPKVLRDQVNRMLDNGVPYKAIIEKLEQSTDPPLPYKLLEINISRWKDNGYQKYLRHQEWRDQLRILRENGSDMSELADGPKFQETLVQIALTEIFRVLEQGELKPDSLNYIRLFNALSRLNREALGLRKYNDHLLAKEQASSSNSILTVTPPKANSAPSPTEPTSSFACHAHFPTKVALLAPRAAFLRCR